MQMRGEKVEEDGGGREMGQTDVKLISRLRRNAPAMPYRYKKEEKRGRFQKKRWKRRGNLDTKREGQQEVENIGNTLANLKSLQQLYDQLGNQRSKVTFR